mgnify:CR=1 FL=1
MADDRDENVIERRVDRRRRLMEQADSPTLRRIVGGVIIAATLYYGLFGSRSFERRAANKTAAEQSSSQLKQPVLTLPNLSLSATPAPVESRGSMEKVSPLSADTIATISEPAVDDAGPQMTMSLDAQVTPEPEMGPPHE